MSLFFVRYSVLGPIHIVGHIQRDLILSERLQNTVELSRKLSFPVSLTMSVAQKLYETNHIISPRVDLWDEPYYAVKEPYFSDQQSGLMFIDQAPSVPFRTSSPFHQVAMQQIMDVGVALRAYAEKNDIHEPDALIPEAKRLLKAVDERIKQEMSRNVFIAGPGQEGGGE